MNNFTDGPWHIVEGRTHGSLEVFSVDTAIAEIWRRGNASLEMANARRIVACINACEGFSIEELDGADLFKDSIESDAEIIALKKQRDELLGILKRLAAVDFGQHWNDDAEDAAVSARAAIAKAEGSV